MNVVRGRWIIYVEVQFARTDTPLTEETIGRAFMADTFLRHGLSFFAAMVCMSFFAELRLGAHSLDIQAQFMKGRSSDKLTTRTMEKYARLFVRLVGLTATDANGNPCGARLLQQWQTSPLCKDSDGYFLHKRFVECVMDSAAKGSFLPCLRGDAQTDKARQRALTMVSSEPSKFAIGSACQKLGFWSKFFWLRQSSSRR